MGSGPDDSKIVLPFGAALWGCMDSLNPRAMTGANAPKGCAGQESLSGEGIASGGQSVDLQRQTYDATCKTVAEARLTPSPFDVGVDHLHQNLTTTTAANTTQPTHSHSSQCPSGSSIVTHEPFDGTQTQDSSFTLVNNRRGGRGRGRGRGSRQPNQRIEFPELNKNEHFSNYKKFFLMKDPNNEPLWPKLNTLEANRELIRIIKGEPKRITELKNGSLLIEVMNKEQSIKIKQIKKLNNIDVVVNEHNSLNSTKGTIYSKGFNIRNSF